jgi:enoyl-CoA hydratase/carnithine racemase
MCTQAHLSSDTEFRGYSQIMASSQIHVVTPAPGYWRATFDHPPINLIDPDTISELDALVSRIETDPDVRIVVFDSANTDFFLAHWDVTSDREALLKMAPGPTGMHPWLDVLSRLSRVPAATIASIAGRARGAGSEFVLACDLRFASREHSRLGQIEVGVGAVPGGGPMARLPRLIGRGRALEVLLGGDDIPGDLAERYGYVNRALSDTELAPFVDALARRIARFDKRAITEIKGYVDAVSLPNDEEFPAALDAFVASMTRPGTKARVTELMKRGMQSNSDLERDLAAHVGADDLPTDYHA